MSVNYNQPLTATETEQLITENPSISQSTGAAISALLGNPTGTDPVIVGQSDADGNVVSPAGEATQIVIVDIPGEDPVNYNVPTAQSTNPVWIFDTDAPVTVVFNTVERVIQMGNGGDDVTVTGDKNTTLEGGGGSDLLETSGGNDSISGDNGNDTINAGAGDDTIAGVLNFDTIDGGAGYDVLMLQGDFADWTVSMAGSAVVFNSVTGQSGGTAGAPYNAQVSNVELVQIAAEAAEQTQFSYAIVAEEGDAADAMRLYQTALGRSADIEGAQFWLDAIEAGATVQQLANDFATSTEFTTIWSNVSTNEELVTQIYENAYGVAPDAEGLAFWVDALDNGLSAGDFIAAVASSTAAEDIANVIVVGTVV